MTEVTSVRRLRINSHATETTVCYPLYSLDDLREAARDYIK